MPQELTDDQIQEALDRTEIILAGMTPALCEQLKWFFQSLANSHWEDVKWADTWEETLQSRARAEFIEGSLVEMRNMVEAMRDALEQQVEEIRTERRIKETASNK
jgi:hypothetical protein